MRWLRISLMSAPVVIWSIWPALMSAVANAETRPAQPWFQGQTLRPPSSATAGQDFDHPTAPSSVQPPTGPQEQSSASDFPTDALNNWMMATAQAAHARAVMHLSESRLDEAIRDARLNFEHSPEYRDAVQAAQKAYDAYTAERQKALRSVVNDPKYQANIELRDQLADSLARIRGSARPNQVPQEELLAIASQKMQYASAAHSMERNATEGDASLQDARRRMVEAQARVTDLRAQFDASIRNNAQVQQARRTLEDSRVMLITAAAYLNASATAGAIATDYAYYRHRWEGLAGPAFTDGWGTPAYGY